MELNRSRQRVTGDQEVVGDLSLTGSGDPATITVDANVLDITTGTGDIRLGGASTTTLTRNVNNQQMVVSGGNDSGNGGNLLVTGANFGTASTASLRSDGTTLFTVDGTGISWFAGSTAAQQEVPASPSAQDIVDALVAYNLITQAA